jgi:2-phosphosulfolactate phosphatase
VHASEPAEFRCRCDWGANGLEALPPADVVIVVDVLSFSTCVDIAVGRGVAIIPYDWNDSSAAVLAACRDAEVAGSRGNSRYSLSPASFLDAPAGLRCVLPSPNGGSVALRGVAAGAMVIAACLRNLTAVAEAVQGLGASCNVIAAGERWQGGTLRRSAEDWVAAGAILQRLPGSKSSRAAAAIGAFERVRGDLRRFLADSTRGRELIASGFECDVELAAEVDVSPNVPIHDGEAFVSALGAGRSGNRKSNGRPGRCV